MRERLLASVKKEVKQLMEEAVTKKFVHEDSSCIISLCATIELCLSHGLKRRSIGIFKANTTMGLLEKISKTSEPAKIVVNLCNDYDDKYCNQNSLSKYFYFYIT
jgi:small G protein signaling modulator 1